MHNQGYSTMCGHGIIAVVTIALEQGLLVPREPGRAGAGRAGRSRYTPRPRFRPRAAGQLSRASRFRNVPSFVLYGGVPVRLGPRTIRADVAFGGAFYAIVDSESAGIPLAGGHLDDLRKRRHGDQVTQIESALTVVHPDEPQLNGIYGTIFTGPPSSGDADLRNVTVFAEAEVDRSPCGTGTCAVMAVLAAMGLLETSSPSRTRASSGPAFSGRVERDHDRRRDPAGHRAPTGGGGVHDRAATPS